MGRKVLHRETWVLRVVGCMAAALGVSYVVWRWGWSLNVSALWFAIPLAAAETYSVVDSLLFLLMMWRPTRRTAPPPIDGAIVDVFVTTYNEPLEVVRPTLAAARKIDWPDLRVHLLDDGDRAEMRALAAELGCGYISRGEEWRGKPRHAKAGNVNNALSRTTGDFILILDADMVAHPGFVRRCLGYFRDPRIAFVQAPQRFYNLPPGDPFGSDAPLFYGPILRGKDGWDAAFFCGSNAILRREALMALGVADYVRSVEREFARRLRSLARRVGATGPVARRLEAAVRAARRALKAGEPFERAAAMLREALAGVPGEAVPAELADLARSAEAMPVLPLATISVTEDMATAMRLHALGWLSVYHDEDLAWGLAPEDLGAALGQRLRWAQGTLQVMLHENPLFVRGLRLGQRLQYATTMYSYFSGFASLVYLLWPIIFLATGIAPVRAWSVEFFARLVPYLLINRIMFAVASRGLGVVRGEQYSLALFPVWIRAVLSVLVGVRPAFVVTPKNRRTGSYLRLVIPQIVVIAATILAVGWAVAEMMFLHRGPGLISLAVNVFWGMFNAYALSVIVRAAVWRRPAGWHPHPPV